ncbi:MAG: hypothetical protein AAF548_00815 [Actinomycetota bacterium]
MDLDPIVLGGYEAVAIRVVLAYTALRFNLVPSDMSKPIGFARIVDVRSLVRGPVMRRIDEALVLAVLLYAAGAWLTAATAVVASILTFKLTVAGSGGAVNHGRSLSVVAFVAAAAGQIAFEICTALEFESSYLVLEDAESSGIWWSIQAILAAYFVSGMSKLAYTRFAWIWRAPGLVLSARGRQVTASHGERAASTRVVDRLVEDSLRYPAMGRVVFGSGLLIELLAPVGFLGPNLMIAVGAAVIALHVANGLVLGLWFQHYQLIVAVHLLRLPYLVRSAWDALV